MAAQRRAIPGFWAYRLGRGHGRRRGDRAQAPAPPAGRAAPIWLHATDAEAAAVLALLARQIGDCAAPRPPS
jgi:hypothetical protein